MMALAAIASGATIMLIIALIYLKLEKKEREKSKKEPAKGV